MKQLYLFLALALCCTGASAQLSIYMKVSGMTTGIGDKVTAFQDNVTSPITGSVTTGKVAFDPIKITKTPGLTMGLMSDSWKGAHVTLVEFDFYDNTNTMVYTVSLSEVNVVKFSNLSPACPSCGSLTDEIWLTYTAITYKDLANNLTWGWNVNLNTPQ